MRAATIAFTKAGVAFAACMFAVSSGAATLLRDFDLGGQQETVLWEQGSLGGGGPTDRSPSTPTSGAGSIVPLAPGYRANAGYYSFSTHFGLSATTELQVSAGFTDIQNVVFQRVSMINTGTEDDPLTAYDNLVWDGAGGPVETQGGPWLSYFDSSGDLLGRVAPTLLAIVAGDQGITIGGITGDIYSFAYQWDLSGVTEDVTKVTIDAPILVHSSTVEARIDIGGGFVQVIPEPSMALLGGIGLLGLLKRRR